ncbi:MAG: hypothetical protein AVDCRST_MAG53-1635 [uncultured Solirubrobacteraceae bacterium]|uniref:PKD domain-containing protein n=1 Tax=uncultured Solirubrobacteraceae bacterium TaxID=1162706 RepID=A0A6J4SIT8_9ACTN|nr:MAG: hypothetical protein AVDCRST_MAG53-1635 [uncultured Solirubrobacteraceae bacterium]
MALGGVLLVWLGEQAEAQAPPCPLAALAPPPMEGAKGYIVVGQPRPCPPQNGTWSDFSVLTDFGDGVIADTPFREGDPLWFMGGAHAYRRAGTYQLRATATHRQTGDQIVLQRPIEIPNAPLTPRPARKPKFVAGQKSRQTIARFHDGNRLAEASDHTATIAWGDERRSKVAVVKRGADFLVIGTHRYSAAKRMRRITVIVRDDRNATVRLSNRAIVRP